SVGRRYNNQFGFLLKHTWIGKPRVSATPDQIHAMDALRANILHTAEAKIRKKAAEEEAALDAIDPAKDIPGQDAATAKSLARQRFYTNLEQEIEYEYAHEQAETLAQTFNYSVMAFNWTSVSAYIPLVTENHQTAPAPGADMITRRAYPLHLNVT